MGSCPCLDHLSHTRVCIIDTADVVTSDSHLTGWEWGQSSLVQFSLLEECLVYRASVNPRLLCFFFFFWSSSCPPPLSLLSLNVISLLLFSQLLQGSLVSCLSLMPHPGNRGIFSCHCPAHPYSSLAAVSLTPSPGLEGEDSPPHLFPSALNPFYSCLPMDLLHYQLPF